MASSPNIIQYHLSRSLPPDGSFSFSTEPKLYAAVYPRGSTSNLCPRDVHVTQLHLSGIGPIQQDTRCAIATFEMITGLRAGINHGEQVIVEYCLLEPVPVDNPCPAPNRGCKYFLDLDLSLPFRAPPVVPTMKEYVGDIKTKNIAKFTECAVSYLSQHGSGDQVAEYNNIMSTKTEAQIANLDSVRIWQQLTMKYEIVKALVGEDLMETSMEFHDLGFPPMLELLPLPLPGRRAAANDGNNETLSDARNCPIPNPAHEKQRRVRKGKAVAAAGMDGAESDAPPYEPPMKKRQHGGVVGIGDGSKALAKDKSFEPDSS